MPANSLEAMNLTYEEAQAVASFLEITPTDHINQADLVSALVNAMNRIHALERRVNDLESEMMFRRSESGPIA